jgi:formiminoglutamase
MAETQTQKHPSSMTATSAAAPALAFPASGYADDPRLGSLITAGDDGELVLVGYACDEGVRRNGGRVGAAQGPAAMRRQLPRMGTLFNPEFGIDLRHALRISDAGDIAASDSAASLEQIHAALRARVASLVARGKVPFVVGGGNDQSFANASGLLDAKRGESSLRLGVINIDAHFDVRPMLPAADPSAPPLAHSGSPFRQLLDSDRVLGRDFVEFAAQGNQCSVHHLRYLQSKQANVVWMSALRHKPAVEHFKDWLDRLSQSCSDIFVSFDIDSISGADAPGVSAVASYGLSALDALEICYAAGAHEKVALFDLSEFNPVVEEHRTARLVVNMFYYFALGLASRHHCAAHGCVRE